MKTSQTANRLYNDLTKKSAVLDISEYGRLYLTGNDSLDLINRLTTNQIDTLPINAGLFTVLTSNKGRIKDLLYIFRETSEKLLLITSPNNQTNVAEWIDFYTFSEDVKVSNISDETKLVSIIGPNSESDSKEFISATENITTFNSSIFGLPCTNFLVPNKLQSKLIQLVQADLPGGNLLDLIRIERFVPLMNRDFSEQNNPLEAGLKKYISFSKGCYIGQEVIARLDAYDKVQRLLVGLEWDEDLQMEPGSALSLEGIQIGNITSSVTSESKIGGIGLGFVKKSFACQNSIVLGINSQGNSTKIKVTNIPDL